MMAPLLDLSIPDTSTSDSTKPFTLYHVSVNLPLRSFVLPKRYSDFTALHEAITSAVGSSPPAALPRKSWLTRTTSSPELTEQRRAGLEMYVRAINESPDDRWRNTDAWKAFLHLPQGTSSAASTTEKASSSGIVTDSTVWLEVFRELKGHLREARLHLERRDQAQRAQDQHENSALAKKCLIKAGGAIYGLEEGLKHAGDTESSRLGSGELRRRKDLVSTAKKEKEGLEALANALLSKKGGGAAATDHDKAALFASQKITQKSGRVLGGNAPETEQTRELDNEGVFQLQKQIMADQDMSVEQLRTIVARQKDMGVAINNELEEQNVMLKMMDEDVDRYAVESGPPFSSLLIVLQGRQKGSSGQETSGKDGLINAISHFEHER